MTPRYVMVTLAERMWNYLEEPHSDQVHGFRDNRRFFSVVDECPICDVAMIYDEIDRFG